MRVSRTTGLGVSGIEGIPPHVDGISMGVSTEISCATLAAGSGSRGSDLRNDLQWYSR